MIIRSQDETAIYDLNKAFSIYASEEGDVLLLGYTGELAYSLGHYKTRDRAKEIVEEIYAVCGVQSRYDMPLV